MTIWKPIARFAARPAVADWLIRRAMKTPYMHLPSNEDPSYMARYWLFNPYDRVTNKPRWFFCPWSIRVHHIKREDHDRAFHDHPWNARTIILKGWYEERRLVTGPERDAILVKTLVNKVGTGLKWDTAEAVEFFNREPGDTAKLGFEEYHQVTEVSEGGVWTLFISGPWQGVWGFLVDGIKVPWRTYLGVPEKGDLGDVVPATKVWLDDDPQPWMVGGKGTTYAGGQLKHMSTDESGVPRNDYTVDLGLPLTPNDGGLSDDPVIKDVAFDAANRISTANFIGKSMLNRGEELPIEERVFDPTLRYNGGPTAEDDTRPVDPLAIGTDIHSRIEKIRINTGIYPWPLAGMTAIEQKLMLNKQFDMCRVSPDIRTWPDSSMLEILKDIEALEAIYKRNPQLETMVGGEFKIRCQDRDDDGMVDPAKIPPELFGEPEDLRHPRTAREWAKQYNPNKEFGKMGWSGKPVECEKLRIADQRGVKGEFRHISHPLEAIAEWRKGCSCAPDDPADCNECTTALIDSIEAWFKQHGGPHK